MGYDINRFENQSKIDSEFICAFCRDVIEKPTRVNAVCEHIFCTDCIASYINGTLESATDKLCPYDRNTICEPYYKSPARYWTNNYNALQIRCFYKSNGCKVTVDLCDLEAHERCCKQNPCAVIQCKEGCGARIARNAVSNHKCLPYLKSTIDQLSQLTLNATSGQHKQHLQTDGTILSELIAIKTQLSAISDRLNNACRKLDEMERALRKMSSKENKFDSLIDIDDSSCEASAPMTTTQHSLPSKPPRNFFYNAE